MDPLEKLSAPLDTAWGVARTLYVTDSERMPSETYQQIHKRARKSRSLKFQSKPIYEACKVTVLGVLHNRIKSITSITFITEDND